MRKLRPLLLDLFWPWGRIRRLKNALAQSIADNAVLQNRLEKTKKRRDTQGRFKQ